MAKVRMDEEGVQALKNLANALPEASQAVMDAANFLKDSFEEKKQVLGPHTGEIERIIETVNDAQASGHSSIIKLQRNLVSAAAALAAIIGKSFGGSLGR